MSAETAKARKVSPPGPTAQYINKLLHTEPYSVIFHGFYWSFFFIVSCPMAGWTHFFVTILKFLRFILNLAPKPIDAKNNEKELAVVISGCDTGFGKDLTFALAAKGFIVFSGCLTETGMKQYEGIHTIFPLKMDVTNEDDLINVTSEISKWMKDPTSKKTRVLHAVVNNAGIGAAGLIDWSSVSTYQKVIDVNYYGLIRTTKAFLPILKVQASTGKHTNARFVNVASVAGLFAGSLGGSIYSGSKHAVEAFSSCLRLELKAFKIGVTTVNPSSHSTNMVSDTDIILKKVWNQLQPEMREEYGEEYFSSLLKSVDKLKQISWSPKYVENALVSCVESYVPKTQVLVGMDAKYFVTVVRNLPMWVQVKVFTLMSTKALPACMKQS